MFDSPHRRFTHDLRMSARLLTPRQIRDRVHQLQEAIKKCDRLLP